MTHALPDLSSPTIQPGREPTRKSDAPNSIDDLLRYAASTSRIEGVDKLLPPSHRAWLLEHLRRTEAGEPVDFSQMRVKMHDVLPADFTSNRIDRQFFDNGNITAIGLWLIDPANRRLKDSDAVAQWIKKRIIDDPKPTPIRAADIGRALDLAEDYVASLLFLITTIDSFWDSHMTPIAGRIGDVQLGNEGTVARMLNFRSVEAEVRDRVNRLVMNSTAEQDRKEQVTRKASGQEFQTLHRYQRVEQIGEGAVGVVYRVRNEDGEEFALKLLKKDHVDSSRHKRFTNEFHWCWNQTHPNIVRVLDWGSTEADGVQVPFYVARLYANTLRKMIKVGMVPERILSLFRGIATGVATAHRAGVWHRDLKPENVFVDGDGAVVVGDFGIARFQEDALATPVETETGDRLANFTYAAPEQRERKGKVDDRADVFALGLMLNEMFTKAVPQGSGYKTIASVSAKHAELDEIVEEMRRQDAGSRPSIGDVLDSLAKWWK